MKYWFKISLLLSVFGFLKDFRPSEHFIYEFLVGPWRNITDKEVTQKVYPVATYSYLAQLIIVFLITDLLRYKPLIIVLGLSGIVIWSMLLWTTSLLNLQILEGFYGTYMATEVAYYTYMYAKVPQEHYQQVTGHARAAILTGRFLSGTIGQLLISFSVMNYRDLNYLTFAAQILATFWAFLLPPVKKSIYFNREITDTTPLNDRGKLRQAFSLLWQHFVTSYSNIHVVKWSLWWAMATCGFIQVQSYMQPLWAEIQPRLDSEKVYNGAVEAILTLLGTLAALLAGSLRTNWKLKGELTLAVCSIIEGAALLIASQTSQVVVSYACYIVFGSLYHFMITVVSSEVAKDIPEDTYGLVFGLNTLIALSLQTIVMLVVVDGDVGMGLSPRNQYLMYGGYFMAIAAVYIVIGVISWSKVKKTECIT
ncbi:uncharacterized protein CBL_06800 [Carabus blaptoides fortunei]